jgi:drug/metabolite transporter (DMT)-like permease
LSARSVDWRTLSPTPDQWLVLFYLGAVASGLAFLLWNLGAKKTDAGTLAVLNNLKVPLAVAASILFFGERADPVRLLTGSGLIFLALLVNGRRKTGRPD